MIRDKYTVYVTMLEEMEITRADIAEWVDGLSWEGRTVSDLSDDEIKDILVAMAYEEYWNVESVEID